MVSVENSGFFFNGFDVVVVDQGLKKVGCGCGGDGDGELVRDGAS